MKAHDALIAWTPVHTTHRPDTIGQVKIGPLLREGAVDWTKPFAFTGGAARVDRRKWRGPKSVAQVFIEFNMLVVRDGINPQAAHKAFLVIDEYAEAISPDIPGAREPSDEDSNKGHSRAHR
jgi:hypothetical protein